MGASKSFLKRIEHTKQFIDTTHGFKAMAWALKKGIKIYAVPLKEKYQDSSKYGKNWCKIEINMQGVKKLGKQLYRQDQLTETILDLYVNLYRRG
jgi:hypothetical protein